MSLLNTCASLVLLYIIYFTLFVLFRCLTLRALMRDAGSGENVLRLSTCDRPSARTSDQRLDFISGRPWKVTCNPRLAMSDESGGNVLRSGVDFGMGPIGAPCNRLVEIPRRLGAD